MPWFTCYMCHHPFWQHGPYDCGVIIEEDSYNSVSGQACYTREYCACAYTMEEQRQFANSLPEDEFEVMHESYGGSVADQ